MLIPVLLVSVNRTFRDDMTLSELETWTERAWAITMAAVAPCERVVAMFQKEPVGAWRLRGTFLTEETYGHEGRRRIGLALGDPLPVLSAYRVPDLNMRRGAVVQPLDLTPLPVERA